MSAREILAGVQWMYLGYFVLLNVIYLSLAFIALIGLRRHMRGASAAERVYSHLQAPVSMIVPAFNEAATIANSVRALLQLRYQHFEVIVVNDGSKDDTLAVLQREFRLQPFPEAYRVQVKTQPVRGIYRSLTHPNLRVIDKENGGGKADAINAGINSARHPLIYAGDEIGMEQVPVDGPALDPFERRVPGYGLTRDPQRRPMQWDPTPQAGFTTGEPWLQVAPHDRNNVEAQKADPRSLLHLYRTLIALRRETPALREGVLDDLRAEGSVLTYCRSAGQRRLRIALNLGHEPVVFDVGEKARLVVSTELDRDGVAVGPKVELRADEGVVLSSDER